MRDAYKIENTIEKLLNGKPTYFLDNSEFKKVISKIKNKNYNIYELYKDQEKVILYTKEEPKVSLFKIISRDSLRHQDILGAILSLNISPSFLGDIIIDNDNYYFYVLSDLDEFLKQNLKMVGRKSVTLEKIDLGYLKNYKRKYEEYKIIVTSLRIDNVISKIIGLNRSKIIDKIKNKEVILNYEILTKSSYNLRENDVFSIRRVGKYKFIKIDNITKKNNLVIKYLKYV